MATISDAELSACANEQERKEYIKARSKQLEKELDAQLESKYIDECEPLIKKAKKLLQKLSICVEYQNQLATNNPKATKIEQTINYYKEQIANRPATLLQKTKEHETEIEKVEHKLALLKAEYEAKVEKLQGKISKLKEDATAFTVENDSYLKHLHTELKIKQQEKKLVLEKFKTKEQIGIEVQLADINEQLEGNYNLAKMTGVDNIRKYHFALPISVSSNSSVSSSKRKPVVVDDSDYESDDE